ncbi:MAG: hypothetical protein WCT31_00745 [Candidatus Micrarchaeia archaeon]
MGRLHYYKQPVDLMAERRLKDSFRNAYERMVVLARAREIAVPVLFLSLQGIMEQVSSDEVVAKPKEFYSQPVKKEPMGKALAKEVKDGAPWVLFNLLDRAATAFVFSLVNFVPQAIALVTLAVCGIGMFLTNIQMAIIAKKIYPKSGSLTALSRLMEELA